MKVQNESPVSKGGLLFRLLVVAFLSVSLSVLSQGNANLEINYFKNIPWNSILVKPMAFAPIPQAKDAYWKKVLPQVFRQDYIKLGENYKGKDWSPISNSLFAEYSKTGNRTNFEKKYFEKRRQLSCLVMAEILEHKGLYLNDIVNGLNYFVSEAWWGLPSSYPSDTPDPNNQKIELFNPETASLLAWTIYMLHDELEGTEKGICKKIHEEIQRRVLIPARVNGYYWGKSTDNWNPWICSNLLSCVLFCEPNRELQVADIRRIAECLEFFITNYPEDGGCDEGIMYWDRAAGSFFECVYLLNLATNHSVSLKNDPKLMAMGSFVYKMYIGKNKYVNFADSYTTNRVHINILYPYGKYIEDDVMMRQAAYIAKDDDFFASPSKSFAASGNYPALSRELLFLSLYNSFVKTKADEPLIRDAELNNLQIFTARAEDASSNGLFLAAKGGNNGEHHNHNDVGNFIVYKDGEPLIIDIGVGAYTARSFSDERYELFNYRSGYHNVPLINGCEQPSGKKYAADKQYRYRSNSRRVNYTIDIAKAYPKEAHVDRWERTFFSGGVKGLWSLKNTGLINT